MLTLIVWLQERVLNLALGLFKVVFDAFELVEFFGRIIVTEQMCFVWWNFGRVTFCSWVLLIEWQRLYVFFHLSGNGLYLWSFIVEFFRLDVLIVLIKLRCIYWTGVFLYRHISLIICCFLVWRYLFLFCVVLYLFLLVFLIDLLKFLQFLSQIYNSTIIFACCSTLLVVILRGHC